MIAKPFLGDKPRLYCNSCGSYTWQKLVAEASASEPIDEDEPDGWAIEQCWKIFQCLGCEHLSLLALIDCPWEHEPTVEYYPARNATTHSAKSYDKLPDTLAKLYKEVVSAFNQGLLLLCAAGLRALLEGVCNERDVLEGPNARGEVTHNLEGRINGLAKVVPRNIVANLHGFRFLGNRALHELEAPDLGDLKLAMTVVEDILNVVYDLDYRSEQFFKKANLKKQVRDGKEDPPSQ